MRLSFRKQCDHFRFPFLHQTHRQVGHESLPSLAIAYHPPDGTGRSFADRPAARYPRPDIWPRESFKAQCAGYGEGCSSLRPRRYESQRAASRPENIAPSIHNGITTGSVSKMIGIRNNAAQMQITAPIAIAGINNTNNNNANSSINRSFRYGV